MLNYFPNFERLSPEQKAEVDLILSLYLPHSDFNFVGLYDYDVGNDKAICRFEEGLAFLLNDYITHKKFLSFIGHQRVDEKISMLLEYSRNNYYTDTLKLVPETIVQNIKEVKGFNIKEDPDNFDYIIDVQDLIDLRGRKWHEVRKEINHFASHYKYDFLPLDLGKPHIQKEVEQLFFHWKEQNPDNSDTDTEFEATKRHLTFSTDPNCLSFGLYVGNRMIGYSMNQIVHSNYYIGHFGKTDNNFRGASRTLEHECAKFFKQKGCTFMNLEQDMGLQGLRKMKQSLNPTMYAKKYDIKLG